MEQADGVAAYDFLLVFQDEKMGVAVLNDIVQLLFVERNTVVKHSHELSQLLEMIFREVFYF